jgi:hypothetical protein
MGAVSATVEGAAIGAERAQGDEPHAGGLRTSVAEFHGSFAFQGREMVRPSVL